jgi:hypothetical protein
MRYHLKILKDIEAYFQNSHLVADAAELDDQVKSGATGLELCYTVGSWLLTYRKRKQDIDKSLGSLIDEFIEYCHFNEIRFHASLY